MAKPTITFYGGTGSVTGANFLLNVGDDNNTKILVDCGLIQGEKFANDENRKGFVYNPAEVNYLFVTHAHLDHVGRIPKLVKDGFKGEIYSTAETKNLARLILEDAVTILEKEAQRDGVLPLYEKFDMEEALRLWKEIPYYTQTQFPGFEVFLQDAGHILGSSMINFTIGEKKVVFTGDLGNSPTPLLRNTDKLEGVHYVVMESVYGDRNHEPSNERKEKLEQVINETINRGGSVIIPAFSLERTQVILYEINSLVEDSKIPHVPVFVDSPLAIKVTDIYKASKRFFNSETQSQIQNGDDIFNFPKLKFTITGEDSRMIDHVHGPKIIIAGSGMSTGGRVMHHEIKYLPDAKNTLLLVGYQSLGTLGRKLVDGAKRVSINGVQVNVNAKIDMIRGYSSHKDSDNLVEFVDTSKETLKKVFVVMGEPKASLFLAQRIKDYLDVNAIYPEKEKVYKLE